MIYMVISIKSFYPFTLFLLERKTHVAETPIVSVMPANNKMYKFFGEYVGRIHAQQFVEVRARVEGFLEQMLFEEGTSVKRNQVLFVINQDQYRAKADKVRAQLKKDEHRRKKAKRDLDSIRPLYEQNARASQLDTDNAVAAYRNSCSQRRYEPDRPGTGYEQN